MTRLVPLEDRVAVAYAFRWTLDDIGSLTLEEWNAVVAFLIEQAKQSGNTNDVRVNTDPRAHLEFLPQ